MVEHFWRSCVLCEEALYYRPQTKFAKVMFLHLSVSHSVHGGGLHGGGAGGWAASPHWILRDMVNEQAVHILLKCILYCYFHCLYTKLWEGNVFTYVCLYTGGGFPACITGHMTRESACRGGVCIYWGVCIQGADPPPPPRN